MFGSYPGSDVDELARWVETSSNLIRAAHRGDIEMVQASLAQLNNIAGGWLLSAHLARQEAVRQGLREELLG